MVRYSFNGTTVQLTVAILLGEAGGPPEQGVMA